VAFYGFDVGAIIGAILGDTFGRRPLLNAHTIIFVPASVFSALSQSLIELMSTRFLVGVSMGLVLPTAVAMISEFTPRQYRGRAVIALPGIAYTLGQTLILLLGIGLISSFGYHCLHCEWWRWMLVAGIIPDLVAITIVALVIPESPRFLLYQNKMDELAEVLRSIGAFNSREEELLDGGKCVPLEPDEQQVDVWKATRELFEEPLVRYMPLGIFTWCFICVPLFANVFLWPIYLEGAGLDHLTQYWLMVLVATAEIPAVIVVMLIIDARSSGDTQLISRRILIVVLLLLSAICCFLVAAAWSIAPAFLIAGNVAVRMFCVAPYEAMYVYVAELLPTSHRNAGLALGNASTKMVAAILPLVLTPLMSLDLNAPYIFVCVCACCALILMWVSPDVGDRLSDTASDLKRLQSSQASPAPARSPETTPLLDKKP